MRWKQLTELIKVNLLYANPQLLEKKRNQQADGRSSFLSAPMSMIMQSVLILVLFSFIYGLMLIGFDFTVYPGYFTFYTLIFILMTMLQGFYIIYNLLYESKDLIYYLPLPFKNSEVFLAKLVVIVITLIPYLAPTYAVFFNLGQDVGRPLLGNILLSFLVFLIVTLFVFLFSIGVVHLISRISLFQTHKKVMTTVLYSISSMGLVAVIFLLTYSDTPNTYGQVLPDNRVIPFLHYLHAFISDPMSQSGLIGIGAWVLAVAVLIILVYKFILPGIYEDSEQNRSSEHTVLRKKGQASRQPLSMRKTLLKYNFGLIQDGTLMMQYLSSNVVFPVLLIVPLLTGEGFSFMNLSAESWWGLIFFIGYLYAYMTLNAISIVGVIISLDRENYDYIKSLPFSMKYYLQTKFWFAFALELILPLIIALAMMLYIQLPWLLILCFLAGVGIGIYGLSEYYFVRDHRLLNVEWQNLTELYNRGGGNIVQAMRIFGVLIVGTLIVLLVVSLMSNLSAIGKLILSIILVTAPTMFTVIRSKNYRKTFWQSFEI